MIEFNPDGSIKLPSRMQAKKDKDESLMRNGRCLKIEREIVSDRAPKRCKLRLKLSDKITDYRFIDTIFNQFKERASVPCSLSKISDKEYEVVIETDFRRCSDCNSLIGRYREFLGNIIDIKGSCTFEGRKKNFCYEDYFQ